MLQHQRSREAPASLPQNRLRSGSNPSEVGQERTAHQVRVVGQGLVPDPYRLQQEALLLIAVGPGGETTRLLGRQAQPLGEPHRPVAEGAVVDRRLDAH